MNTLQDIVLRQYQDEERLHSIQREREEVQSNVEFQKWVKDMHIGSRIEVKDTRAEELNMQYDWTKLREQGHSYLPAFVARLF